MDTEKPHRGRPRIGDNVCWMQFSLTCEQKKWLQSKKNASRWLREQIEAEMKQEKKEETHA